MVSHCFLEVQLSRVIAFFMLVSSFPKGSETLMSECIYSSLPSHCSLLTAHCHLLLTFHHNLPLIRAKRRGRQTGMVAQITCRRIFERIARGKGRGHLRTGNDDAVAVDCGVSRLELAIRACDGESVQCSAVRGVQTAFN